MKKKLILSFIIIGLNTMIYLSANASLANDETIRTADSLKNNTVSYRKKAFITGINGQDGSYLAEFLLSKDYEVHGLLRRVSYPHTGRINHLRKSEQFFLHYGDVTDALNLVRLIGEVKPDEVYHLAAQSHVGISFEAPQYTAENDALGTLRILEAIKLNNLTHYTRFYQASTSELYGKVQAVPQNEQTPFYPRSPYGVAKLYAYWITVNYREAYGMFACNGILFNHESPSRGEIFVTRKIVKALTRIANGSDECMHIGNLEACRDWGYAPDYVEAMWLMLQHDTPEDFVIATGQTHSVREFIQECALLLDISLEWHGSGIDEYAIDKKTGKKIIVVDPTLFRPTEVDLLLGDYTKARTVLGWQPTVTFKELVKIMVEAELKAVFNN
ncbi:MAG: GDP-mannose 4,6-dehydratase [Candidatus Dependentiae bacterium]|nr:GDP-mannose 4,6-dehydratase [Candidatus Dependentiae bacterium]